MGELTNMGFLLLRKWYLSNKMQVNVHRTTFIHLYFIRFDEASQLTWNDAI